MRDEWVDPELESCFDEDEARTIDFLAQEIAYSAKRLQQRWGQDLQKQKWRDRVRDAHDELCEALAKLKEELDK